MATIKNSSFMDQLAFLKFLYYLLIVGIPVTIVILAGEGNFADRISVFFTNIKVILFILIFVILAFGGNLILKRGYLDEYKKYIKITKVQFKEEKVVISKTDGKDIEIPWTEIMNVDYATSYEIKELEYSRNNLIIQREEEVLVFPFTSKEIYYKFLDVLDNASLGKGYGEE